MLVVKLDTKTQKNCVKSISEIFRLFYVPLVHISRTTNLAPQLKRHKNLTNERPGNEIYWFSCSEVDCWEFGMAN